MTTIDPASTAALALIRQANRSSTAQPTSPEKQPDLSAIAAGGSTRNSVAVERQPSKAQSSISDANVQMLAQKENGAKVALIKAIGQAVGVDEDKFSSNFDYAKAVGAEIEKMRNSPGGDDALSALSKKLGLDKLGISLDTMVKAIMVPSGDEGKQLDAAIAKEFDQAGQERLLSLKNATETLTSVSQDENGVYRPGAPSPGAKTTDDKAGKSVDETPENVTSQPADADANSNR